MVQTVKRSLALFMVLAMCLAFVPAFSLRTSAANIDYVYDGDYVYNWGTREQTATFLSPMAETFYTGDNAYDVLSAYAGGTGVSDAPNSALYDALHDVMADAHSYKTSYDATRPLFKYTDCQNSAGAISSFYSGNSIGPDWDAGSTWNREHTWPNSKGLGGDDENDIIMLRPTAKSENGSRSNKAYGESSGYYNPNLESNGAHDLRGDVARIFLYVYVRWENVNGNGSYTAWGSSGVIESVEVLLKWMAADPVDTWELGRNDSVEAITGTRNVFVDYPEFAFKLFGADIPADMTTPSGEGDGRCDHNNFDAGVVTAPTCTNAGYTTYTCKTTGCSYSYKANIVKATGHKYTSGTCSVCGTAEPIAPATPQYVTEIEVGKAYKLGLHSTNKNATYYFTGAMSGYYGATDTNYDKGIDVYAEQTSGGYHLYFNNASGAKKYINLVLSGTYRNFTFADTASSVFTWDAAKNSFYTTLSGETCYIGTYGTYVTMGVLRSSMLKDTDYIARFYTMTTSVCSHNYESVVTAPTCTEDGYTTYTCTLCKDSYTGNVVQANGHSFANGTCSECGAKAPEQTETKVTISFKDKANRTSFSTSQQIWEQNGIKLTNDKASSTSNVGDYFNPGRFYKSSKVTIEYPGMTKIEINCSGLDAKYVDPWKSVSGATATESNKIVTIVFNEPVDSLVYTTLSAQARAYDMTIYAEVDESACAHANTTTEGASKATCTVNGFTGKVTCSDCGEVIDEGEVITAPGHNYVNKVCDTCGEAEPQYTVHFVLPNGAKAIESMTCGVAGITLPTSSAINGFTFVGWVSAPVVNAEEAPSHSKAGTAFKPTADTVLYALYSYETEGEGGGSATTGTASLSFANKAQRTTFTSTQQVWEQNGIKLINDKASSSNAVADYANPARFYASSKLTIERAGMTKIVFTCGSSSYATALKNSLGTVSGRTVSVSGSTVTVTFTTPVDSLVIAKLTAQVRMNSMSVTYTEGSASATVTCYTTVIGEGACTHANTSPVAEKANNCTENGWSKYVDCDACDYTTCVIIPATGHDEINHDAKAPTCTEKGWNAYVTCTVCDYSTYVELPANGHSEIKHDAKAPTCTEKGWNAYVTCENCDYTTYVEISAKGHNYGEWIDKVHAGCTFGGTLGHYHCPDCNKNFDKDHNEIADLTITPGHEFDEWVDAVAKTCTSDGNVGYYYCPKCENYYDADMNELNKVIVKASHNYGKWIPKKAPTCTEDGYVGHVHCDDCGLDLDDRLRVIENIVIPAAHKLGSWIAPVDATCTENGTVGHYNCSVCNKNFDAEYSEIENIVINAAHNYGEWLEQIDATCTKDGAIAHYHCDKCDKNFDADYNELDDIAIKSEGHTFGEWIEQIDATCTENGTLGHYNCSVCNKNFDADHKALDSIVINAAHTFGEWIVQIDATCTEDGTLGHFTCSECNKNFDENSNELDTLVIKATGHSFGDWVVTKEATTEAEGEKSRECAHCDAIETEKIDKLPPVIDDNNDEDDKTDDENKTDTTEKPTEKVTEKATEPAEEKKGCGGVIATTAVVMTSVLALGAAFVAKKKED